MRSSRITSKAAMIVSPQPSGNDVGQQPEEAGALDRLGELALLLRGHCGDAGRHDLAAFRNETLQQLHILVVDLRRIGAGERAGLAAPEERTPAAKAATAASTLAAAISAGAIRSRIHASPPGARSAGAGARSPPSRGPRSPSPPSYSRRRGPRSPRS